MKDGMVEILHAERPEKAVTGPTGKKVEIFDLSESGKKEKSTKIAQWERKLLDLSLRNMLLNVRLTKSVIPLLCDDVSVLEDALSDGEEFRVMPAPSEMGRAAIRNITFEKLGKPEKFKDYIILEGKSRRLHTIYTEDELHYSLTKLYRSAKSSLEEKGVSTLYLAVGLQNTG